jgi:hypothetical protein
MDPTGPEPGERAFVLDGSSMRMAHTPAMTKRFPPGSNQHGEGHWPVIRVLVAHDLQTGLAMRPEWGPMNGPDAVSEQRLLDDAIDRLPGGSTIVGDANFGVFSVAWTATQAGHPILLRMTLVRARRLVGQQLGEMDRTIEWKPSREDRRSHPDLPPDACVRGRLIVRLVRRDKGAAPLLLALFTTLAADQQQVLQLYDRRWSIETDLRTLKRQLGLDQLTSATPEMAAKEIDMCMAAYNLVRAVICLAAQQSGLPPRSYGFTAVRRIIETFIPGVTAATDLPSGQREFDRMMYYVQNAKLPQRHRKRPAYPRAVWGKGSTFPSRGR